MTFTSVTIRKLRALNLEEPIFEAVLQIFEDAREAKVQKKGCAADRAVRATRLPDDWILPEEMKQWALRIGMQPREVVREAIAFKSYWLNCAGPRGQKLKWDLTWQTWCRRMLERAGRQPIDPETASAALVEGPEAFTDATWKAIAKRYRATGQWNPEWGAPPDRMDCKMPDAYL